MKSKVSSLFLNLLAIHLATITNVWAQSQLTPSADVCIDDINSLEEIDELMDATMVMLDAYNETCTANGKCSASAVPGTAVTKNDYTSLVVSNSLGKMESTCNSIVPGSTLCLVTNEVKKGELNTLELNKPVCVPPSCDESRISDIRFLDPNPASCDPTSVSEPCEVISTAVMCPELRPQQLDSVQCQNDATTIESDRRLNPFMSTLRSAVVRACISVLLGQESELCEISTPLSVTGIKDFTDIDTSGMKEYDAFEEKCKNAGTPTTLCKMTVDINAIESESFIDIETNLIYTDIPLCLPDTCSDQDPISIAQEQLVKDNFKCDSVTSFCKVDVTAFTCDSGTEMSTSLPIQETIEATPLTSVAPTTLNSASPSVHTSGTPTILTSSSPSIEMSLGPSTTPPKSISTFPPSASPSKHTSSSPSVTVSLIPSKDAGDKVVEVDSVEKFGDIIAVVENATDTSGSERNVITCFHHSTLLGFLAFSGMWFAW